MSYNKKFVEKKEYEQFITSKYPEKKLAILSCMDARLTELLTAALGLKNGDAKIIKNAGGVISHPFGSVMRSLLIAVYELGVEEILVIGHTDCGVRHMDSDRLIDKMKASGVTEESFEQLKYFGVDFNSWLCGFEDLNSSVRDSVDMIKKHPLLPNHIEVYGMVIDSVTGELSRI